MSAGTDRDFDALLDPDAGAGPVTPATSAPATAPPAPAAAATAPLSASEGHSFPHLANHTPHGHESAPTWNEFVSGWHLGLYQDPILCAVLSGAALGLLGVFLVLRRAVFVTAAVSQSAGLGVLLAAFLNMRLSGVGVQVPAVLGALVLSLSTTGLLTAARGAARLPRETVLGFAYIAASALAILVGDRVQQDAHDVASILFGTAVLVRPLDLWLVAAITLLVVGVVGGAYQGLVFVGFDAEAARIQRLPARFLEALLWVLVALTVSVTTRAIGALPVFAFAVLPAMAALLLVRRLRVALVASALLGAALGGGGYLFAFFAEFPVGAAQAGLASALLAVCYALQRLLRAA